MQFFFEMSFEDFCASRGFREGDLRLEECEGQLLTLWREEANRRFAAIKASSHYHGGVPCADVHDKRGQVLEA